MRSAIHPPRDLLEQIAHVVDEASARALDHMAAFVELEHDEVVLGVRTFDRHPADLLGHLVAPPTWWAFLLCTTGRAHFLDEPDRAPEPILSTFARSRAGHEVSLLRRGDEVTRLTGPAEGRIPDLVRAILAPSPAGIPTDRVGSWP